MFRNKLSIVVIVAIFLFCCAAEAEQISVSWDGGGDGHSWEDPCNWEPNIVPDNNGIDTFAVTIDGGAGRVQVNPHSSRTIDRLDCYGEVEMYMGVYQSFHTNSMAIDLTLNEPNGLTNYGDLRFFIYGAQFSRVVGNITNRGMMEMESDNGYINGNVTNFSGAELCLMDLWVTGNVYNFAGGMIEIERIVDMVGVMENAGSIEIISAGELIVDNTFNNMGQIQMNGGLCESEDIFHNDVNGVIKGFGVLFAEQVLHNEGAIYAYGGSLSIGSDVGLINEGVLGNYPLSSLHIRPTVDVINNDTINVNAGGGVAFDCNLVNEPNGVIELPGGTLAAISITQTTDANFAGFGLITGDILIESGAKIELTGPTNIVGDVNIPAGATLEISDGQTLITGHTTCDGTIHLIGGTVVFQGGCDCEDCNIINEAGIDRNHFDLNADGIEDFKDFAYFAETWLWQASWY
jgi:hypothetical protein